MQHTTVRILLKLTVEASNALMKSVPCGRLNVTVGDKARSLARFVICIGMRIAVTTPAETVLIVESTAPSTL